MAAFLFAPAFATRPRHAGPLPCRRCSPPVGVPRRSRAFMAVPAEAQRAFDRRMNEVCNEVVCCPPPSTPYFRCCRLLWKGAMLPVRALF